MSGLDMRAHALRYAAMGWPVFLINPSTNAPYRGSHGFKDATTDAEQVTKWWTERPHAAIGVPTGVAFDVLDVDVIDDRPPLEWAEGHPGVGILPSCEVHTWQARSGGGKWHIYFKPTGLGRRIRFAGSCDWLGTNGYVIVPPSGHKSGGRYEWIWSPDDVELADAPVSLAVAVMRAKDQPATQERTSAPQRPATGRVGSWSPDGLLGRVARAVEGERNTVTHWAAVQIGGDVRDGKIDRATGDTACADLERVAIGTGLELKAVQATIESGYAAGLAGKRKKVAA